MKTKTLILLISSIFGGLYAEAIDMILTDKWQFISIALVVILDAALGITRALLQKQFETKKAFKGVYMLVVFWCILAVLLSLEKGFPYASFLSEAILLPICVFQIISIVKNAHLLGIISGSLADRILLNIDKHKEDKEDLLN